jgi:hypothetical protein
MIRSVRTNTVCPAWLGAGLRGDKFWHQPTNGMTYFAAETDKYTTWVLTDPPAETLDEARERVRDGR